MLFLSRMEKLGGGGGLKVMISRVQVWFLGPGMGMVQAVVAAGVSQVERGADLNRIGCRLVLLRSSRKSLGDRQRCRQTVGRCTRP